MSGAGNRVSLCYRLAFLNVHAPLCLFMWASGNKSSCSIISFPRDPMACHSTVISYTSNSLRDILETVGVIPMVKTSAKTTLRVCHASDVAHTSSRFDGTQKGISWMDSALIIYSSAANEKHTVDPNWNTLQPPRENTMSVELIKST